MNHSNVFNHAVTPKFNVLTGKTLLTITAFLLASGTAWAANGTHDGNICTLDNDDFCYSPDELYPVGTNICDTWESDGSCSMDGVSGGHSGSGLEYRAESRLKPINGGQSGYGPVRPDDNER